MVQQKTATLTTIFSEVLANLAFMFTEDEPIDPTSGEVWLETVISYRGPCTGTLRFRCSRDFSVLLAANLLGIDPDDNSATLQSEDAVKEFMNIVCGQFVTAMHGMDDVYNLSIPQVRELPETPDFSDGDDDATSTLSVDGHKVQLAYDPGDGGCEG